MFNRGSAATMSTKVLFMLALVFVLQMIVFFAARPKAARIDLER
jgi:hypothetical protein